LSNSSGKLLDYVIQKRKIPR